MHFGSCNQLKQKGVNLRDVSRRVKRARKHKKGAAEAAERAQNVDII